MSSLIEWPSIYGSSYFIPAIIVVVLLLALLLLMSSRRRAAAEAARNVAEPFDEAEAPDPAAAEEGEPAEAAATPADAPAQPLAVPAVAAPLPVAAALPVATAPAVLPVMAVVMPAEEPAPTPDLRLVASGRNARVTVRTQGPVSGVVRSDPLNAALLDILGGWGDLSPEDMKRLELFRPERLVAAIAAVQLPNSKSGEAKARLSQLRRYSADLERSSSAAQTVAAAAAQTVAEPEAATTPALADASVPGAATTVTEGPAADGAELAAVPSGGAAAGLAALVTLGTARQPAPESFGEFSAEAETEAETVTGAAGVAAATSYRSGFDDLASFWAEPRPLWEMDAEASFQELPAPTYREVEVRPEGNGGAAEETTVYPPLAAVPLTNVAQSDTPGATAPLTSVDTFFWDDNMPTDALSRLPVRVETAEQLLALPPQERIDMTAFLEPAELTATFRATKDPDLKKAVIDTLEHIGSPASLNALGNCFEDNDSDIQVYALQAADRLLGVA